MISGRHFPHKDHPREGYESWCGSFTRHAFDGHRRRGRKLGRYASRDDRISGSVGRPASDAVTESEPARQGWSEVPRQMRTKSFRAARAVPG